MLRFLWFVILPLAALVMLSIFPIHMLQLESYQLPGYFRVLRREARRVWLPGVTVCLAGLVCTLLLSLFFPRFFLTPVVLVAAALAFFLAGRQHKAKKPLVFTQRVQRLLAITAVCEFLVLLILYLTPPDSVLALLVSILCAFIPFLVALGAAAAQPIEKRINLSYYRDAQKILSGRQDLIKIGITGSYGKTSTKFILKTILDEKYNVLATPSSFNTPMGITRVVREQLKPEHEVFLAEMGARHRGDIRELTDLVHPTIGIITSVGKQHLETMHSIENIASTKFELIEALPKDGMGIFFADGAYCEGLYELSAACQKTLVGLDGKGSVSARDIKVGPEGASFLLCTPKGDIACTTRLLSVHNIQNIAMASACALYLGLSLEQIRDGISKLEGVEHRMQLIRGAAGNTVIDDAFNANPAGAKAAVEVLSQFPGRRIIVTPGMVELGEEEEALNREFGRQIAEGVDIAILIGDTRTRPIQQGLEDKGFPKESTFVLPTLDDATLWMQKNSRPGDVVLFENDLPDNY